jgi:hypothetical protein
VKRNHLQRRDVARPQHAQSQNDRALVQVAMAHQVLPAIVGELVGALAGIGLDRRASSARVPWRKTSVSKSTKVPGRTRETTLVSGAAL